MCLGCGLCFDIVGVPQKNNKQKNSLKVEKKKKTT